MSEANADWEARWAEKHRRREDHYLTQEEQRQVVMAFAMVFSSIEIQEADYQIASSCNGVRITFREHVNAYRKCILFSRHSFKGEINALSEATQSVIVQAISRMIYMPCKGINDTFLVIAS